MYHFRGGDCGGGGGGDGVASYVVLRVLYYLSAWNVWCCSGVELY